MIAGDHRTRNIVSLGRGKKSKKGSSSLKQPTAESQGSDEGK